MKSSQVRDLARRYATGKLSQENYRSQRRLLIDSITGGQQPLAYRQEPAGSRKRINAKYLSVAVVVLIAAGLGGVLLLRHPAKTHTAAAGTAAPPAIVPPPLPPAPGPELVRSFVETNDWSDGSLENFSRRWQGLSTDDQAEARDSLMYPRLVSAVRQQIDSEKAVAGGLGSPDAHLTELQKMAKTLGVAGS